MNNAILTRISLLLLAIFAIGFQSCVDEEFDAPPVGEFPSLSANATIADVKALHSLGSNAVQITDDLIIRAVVSGDDESGNLFRQIAVQDETGGIILRLNATELYTEFPVGREVFLVLQGMYVGDFNGLYQINGSPEDPIAELLIPDVVIGGQRDQPLNVNTVTITDLEDDDLINELQSTRVKLEDVQFVDADSEAPYADAVNRQSINRNLEDCDGNIVIVRTSGFSDIAPELTPAGKGSIEAVLSIFGDTRQLTIISLDDVQMDGPRCDGSTGGGGGTGNETLVDISDVRGLWMGTETTITEEWKIEGVVISDDENRNINGQNMFVQDGTAGIVVRLTDFHDFELNERVEVVISGQELSEFNGLLQVNNVPPGNVTSLGAGSSPTPTTITVADILNNLEALESTLVLLEDVTLTGGSTYAGGLTVTDPTGSIGMFTLNSALFSGESVPSGQVDLTAIVSQFNEAQVIIRNLDDVSGGGGMTGGGDPQLTDISNIRSQYSGTTTTVSGDLKIRGVVISDRDNGNWTGRNLVVQDGSAGIVVRFSDNHNFSLGEEIEVVVTGAELSDFNELLQVNNVPNGDAVSFGPGTLPAPQTVTISQILGDLASYESELVLIENVTFGGNSVFDGVGNINDGTGELGIFTRGDASFLGSPVPSGSVNLTGVVSTFNGAQLTMRNLDDIQ